MAAPRKPTQLESLACGIIAGCVEGATTYPTEYLKTQAQFSSSKGKSLVGILSETIKSRGISGLYAGSGALIAGTGLKAGVRFMTYDTIKGLLATEQGTMTTGRTVIAGLGAGVVEAAIAVTPSETIKTKLIQDAASPSPKYTGTMNGTITICRTEGFGGIYRGLGPTILKQGANSAIRFTSFATLQDLLVTYTKPPTGKLSSTSTFGVGAIAGLITVYLTMPLDNVKTRMQSVEARSQYRNSIHCLYKTATQEGVLRLWGGTTPRLARLMLSGGIIFTVYDSLMELLMTYRP